LTCTQANEPPVTGRILEILQASASPELSFVVIDVFSVAVTRHELFGMPMHMRRLDEITVLVVKANVRLSWNCTTMNVTDEFSEYPLRLQCPA
jgi:hypothetical protein